MTPLLPYTTLFRSRDGPDRRAGIGRTRRDRNRGLLSRARRDRQLARPADGAADHTACLSSVSFALPTLRSEEHTSELQSLMRISYAVFCLKKKTNNMHT